MPQIEDNQTRLICLDADLPETNSLELIEELQRRFPYKPILVVTADQDIEKAVAHLKAGAADYLQKPVESKRIASFVQTATTRLLEPAQQEGEREIMPDVPGYYLERILGTGKHGQVYLARRRHEEGTLRLAIKVINLFSHGQRRRLALRRFLREVEAMSRLRHPHIVRVIENGMTAGGMPFVVMEYVEGITLRELMNSPRELSRNEATRILLQAADGIQAIHEQGIIHRDIKPHNLMINPETLYVKLTDFGVARIPNSEITQTFSLVGTPSYLAPEVFASLQVDARCDLFSLGVVAYELLTGHRPFVGDDLISLSRSIPYDLPPNPARLVPGFPDTLNTILARLLQKKPEFRYASAALVRDDLQAFLADRDISPSPTENKETETENVWS